MLWGLKVNSRYQSKRDQFEADHQRLQELIAEDSEITKYLGFKDDAVERLRLERQQNDCRDKMNELALKCDCLKNELQAFEAEEEALQTLINFLKLVNFELVARIYRSCLANSRPRLVPDTLEALVRQLADIPGEPDEPEPLLRFVSLLIKEPSLESEQWESLKTWASKQGIPIQEEKPAQLGTAEIYLMVKVRPRSLNDSSLGYLLSAAIVKDPDPSNLEVELMTTPITIPEGTNPKYAPGYSQDELPDILSELIAACGGKHHIPLIDLVVQWFLPVELMSLPIEHWQIRTGRNQKPCSGQRCKAVIVRSYDRHFLPDYQSVVGDWRKYWTRLSDCLKSECTETLVPLDPKSGKATMDWNKPRVIGCKFIEHDDQQQQVVFWDNLLGQGVSIALWVRQSGATRQTGMKMMKSVTKCSIAKLSEALAQQRQKALSKEPEADRLKTASLCLLWDNPFRPFPTIDYESV